MIRLYPPPPARCCPHPENDAAGKVALMITLPLPLPLPATGLFLLLLCLFDESGETGRTGSFTRFYYYYGDKQWRHRSRGNRASIEADGAY